MSSELSAGTIFAERYRIERRIASGGMGAVYEVVHLETTRRRALKVLHAHFVESEHVRSRFRQEAQVAAQIDSDYIVDVFDAGIDAATEMPFLVMELLRGEDLRSRIRRAGSLPPEEAVRYLYEASLGLDKTHQARIVHRDLKPDNLFLCEREHGPPRVKVLDFGISKILADGAMQGQTVQALGTPLYMAPEQFTMHGGISSATDIYALGLIAYTMLVGKPYWLEERKQSGGVIIFAMHAAKGPEESAVARAAKQGITLPPAFDAWFFCATAANQTDRFSSASLAIASLADVLGVALPYEYTSGGTGPTSPPNAPLPSPCIELDVDSDQTAKAASSERSAPSVQSAATLASCGVTTAPRVSRKGSVVMVIGVLVITTAGSLATYRYWASEAGFAAQPATVASPLATENSSNVPPPVMVEPRVNSSAASEASTTPTAPAPSASASAEPGPKAITDGKTVPIRPSITTKKPAGNEIWNND